MCAEKQKHIKKKMWFCKYIEGQSITAAVTLPSLSTPAVWPDATRTLSGWRVRLQEEQKQLIINSFQITRRGCTGFLDKNLFKYIAQCTYPFTVCNGIHQGKVTSVTGGQIKCSLYRTGTRKNVLVVLAFYFSNIGFEKKVLTFWLN